MEHKVIAIKNEQYYAVPDTTSLRYENTCEQCCFHDPSSSSSKCRLVFDVRPCIDVDAEYGGSHFLVPVSPKKSLVVKTFTKEQIATAYHDWNGEGGDEFANHVEKFSDPEYQEFMRLKEKFNT